MAQQFDLVVLGTGTAARGVENDLVIGAHLVGPYADEVINLFALAIRQGLTAEQLKTTMFAYPTGASDISYKL